jgi:glutaredoxin
VPIVSAPDPDEALRAAERERITKADIWKTLPALTNNEPKDAAAGTPTTLPDALPVVTVPSLPAAIVSASELENQRRLAIEEAQRDEARHAAIASAMEKRAEEQRREHQAAAITEAREKVRIVMYGAPWCGVCRKALAYMHDKRITFTEHNIEVEPSARTTLRRLNPGGSIPTFQIDDDVVVGFGPRSFEHALDTAARRRAGL